ncbi:MAG TPA: hypothetical protein VF058_07500 [Actinomycetota bacterium]
MEEVAVESPEATPTRVGVVSPRMVPRSLRVGAVAAAGMAIFYVTVVWGLSGSLDHLLEQLRLDWYLLLPIVAGFGVQVGLVAELRRRHSARRAAMAAGATGAGSSTVGMIACCVHHLADLAPLVGAGAAASFLVDYRVPFMVAGIAINAAGIAVAARALRHLGGAREEDACDAH